MAVIQNTQNIARTMANQLEQNLRLNQLNFQDYEQVGRNQMNGLNHIKFEVIDRDSSIDEMVRAQAIKRGMSLSSSSAVIRVTEEEYNKKLKLLAEYHDNEEKIRLREIQIIEVKRLLILQNEKEERDSFEALGYRTERKITL